MKLLAAQRYISFSGCKIATGKNHHRFTADKDSPVAQWDAPILQTLQSAPLNLFFLNALLVEILIPLSPDPAFFV